MKQPEPKNITLAAFLAWEQQQTQRYEWIDGTVICCAGGSDEHAAIISNLDAAFHAAAGSGPCFVRGLIANSCHAMRKATTPAPFTPTSLSRVRREIGAETPPICLPSS